MEKRLISVQPEKGLKLLLTYASGEKKLFDVEPYAHGNWFGELRDPNYFSSVMLLPNGTGIEWPDGQDIAPHELYELGVDA